MKTHKFKLLKNAKPHPNTNQEVVEKPELEPPSELNQLIGEPGPSSNSTTEPAPAMPSTSSFIPKLTPFGDGEKLTLKGDPNSMIDLETGQSFVKKTVADTLITNLMRHTRSGGLHNE